MENKSWTEEERLSLAAKLDSELDEFIDSLEKKRYAEGWPEDRWQEEMEKHPFFMKKTPQPGDEVHPMFEGLQKLKYDPEENSKEELASNYKDDGNFYLKHRKFRMAVYSYTEGIKVKCEDPQIQAVLYNNRSAAHYYLKNYRSALNDAQRALEHKSDYAKPRWRAAQCAYHLGRFDMCRELCEQILEKDPEQSEAKALLKRSKASKLEAERDQRKVAATDRTRSTRFQRLCNVLKERGVKFDALEENKPLREETLRPPFGPLEDFPVHFDEDNETLVWPVAFSYSEFLLSDFQQQVPENVTMEDCLTSLFAEPLPCDKTNSYRLGNITVYYENRKAGSVHKVDLLRTIRDIINEKGFYVTGGSLLFYVVPTGSRIEEEYINQQRRPMVYHSMQ